MNEPRRPNLAPTSASSSLCCKVVVPNIIPPGTVARRIQHLQNLSCSSTSQILQPKSRHRDDSRTTFGRRLTTRFGLPALRNTKPDEESQVEARHTFQGLRTPRTKHTEDHGNSDSAQTPRLYSEPRPRGIIPRTDATVRWAGSSRSKAARSMGRRFASSDSSTLKEANRNVSPRKHSSGMTIFPSAASEDEQDNNGTVNMQQNFENSDLTIATTSTLRRKSVRDLFEQYGIERPEGLASSSEASLKADHLSIRHHRNCHLCSWVNAGMSVKCRKCGHNLCSKCNDLSPLPVIEKEGSLDYIETPEAAKPLARPLPNSVEPEGTIRKQSGTKNHPLNVEQIIHSRKASPPQDRVRPALATPLLDRKVRRSVKDSPFLIADLLCPGQALHLFPAETDNGYIADTSMVDDPLIVTTQPSPPTMVTSQTECRASRPQSQATPVSMPPNQPSQYSKRLSIGSFCGKYVPEYVQCHGYPRTGHSQFGSPVTSGIVGECQHCLDDCQCAACQNAHHHVRCCVHVDHKSIVHHHKIQQKVVIPAVSKAIPENSKRASRAEKQASLGLQIKPMLQEEYTPGPESDRRPGSSIEVSQSTANLTTDLEILSQPVSADGYLNSSKDSISPNPCWHTNPTLPRSKTFISKELQSPIPQTWDENPQNAISLGGRGGKDFCPERSGADTAFITRGLSRPGMMPCVKTNERVPRPIKRSSQSATTKRAYGKVSRRLSAMFQLKSISPVPLLNQKLKEHQEDLKRIDRKVEAGIKCGSVERRVSAIERNQTATDSSNPFKIDRMASPDNSKDEIKKRRLTLVDKDPSACCENSNYEFANEHRLDEVKMTTETDGSDPKSKWKPWIQPPPSDLKIDGYSKDDGLIEEGRMKTFVEPKIGCVTVILQFEGREDMVFKAGPWTGQQTAI